MSGMKVMNMGDENIQHSGSGGGDRPEDNDQEVRALVRQVRELNSQMEALRQEMEQEIDGVTNGVPSKSSGKVSGGSMTPTRSTASFSPIRCATAG